MTRLQWIWLACSVGLYVGCVAWIWMHSGKRRGEIPPPLLRVLRWWERKGLAAPHAIAGRLVLWPVVQALGLVLCLVVLLGWGRYQARQVWRALH